MIYGHPEGIYTVVRDNLNDNRKDPYRMTLIFFCVYFEFKNDSANA